jgi:LPS export ABC transporter protein LptC
MLNLKRILGCLIILSILILGAVIWRHLDRYEPQQLVELLPEDVELALQDLHYTHNEEGRKLWTLDADKAEYLKESSVAKLEDVRLIYFQTRSFGDVRLRADRGEMDQDSRQLDIWGDIVLTTENQEQFFTDRLHYDDQQRLLSTEEPVRMVSPRLELTGTGMELDIERGYMLVKKAVRVQIQPAKDKKVE